MVLGRKRLHRVSRKRLLAKRCSTKRVCRGDTTAIEDDAIILAGLSSHETAVQDDMIIVAAQPRDETVVEESMIISASESRDKTAVGHDVINVAGESGDETAVQHDVINVAGEFGDESDDETAVQNDLTTYDDRCYVRYGLNQNGYNLLCSLGAPIAFFNILHFLTTRFGVPRGYAVPLP